MDELEFLIILVFLAPVVLFIMAIVALVKVSGLSSRLSVLDFNYSRQLKGLREEIEELKKHGAPPATVTERVPDETVSEDLPEQATDEAVTDTVENKAGEEASPDENATQEKIDEEADDEDQPATQPWRAAARKKNALPKPKIDFESLIGGRWSVLLGGLALALGVVFLVKHTIEAGLLGPGARVLLGALFSAALFAVGEWLRRSDRDFDLPVYEKADVPGILTGAGAIGAFATLYAAHALYGFVGQGTAFVGLTVIGIASMMLSAVHGPKLAALGLLGAYAAPLLVESQAPNPIALALHVLVVTASVLATARLRSWRWLAICGFVGSTIWIVLTAISSFTPHPMHGVAGLMLLCGTALLYSALFWVLEDEAIEDSKPEPTSILAYALLTLAFVFQLAVNADLPATPTAIGVTVIIATIAAMRSSVAPSAIFAVIIAVLTVASSSLPFAIRDGLTQTSDLTQGLVPPDTFSFVLNAAIVSLPAALVGLWGARRSALAAPVAAGWLASAVSAMAFFAILVAYLRISPFETKPLIGAIAILIAGLLALVTEYFIRMEPENNRLPAPAAFAVGAISCTSLALAISLESGWMPLAFALTAFGITAIYTRRPLATLPWLAVASTLITGFTLWVNMPLELPEVSGPVIVNTLIILLAIPAVALLGGGELLRRATPAAPLLTQTGLTASGLAVAGLFVGLEITHFINNGSLANVRHSLAETAGYTLAALGFAIGLQQLGRRAGIAIYDRASQVAGIISVIIAAIGLLIVYNPGLEGSHVGEGFVFNLLLPGYLLTGIAATIVALISRPVRPRWYTLMYAALAGLLLFTYFSLMLRKSFQGPYLGINRITSELEFWLYSPLWLAMGAIVLAVGLRLKSLPLRIASGVLISLTVVKVFVLDMASLTGFLRALSFIGLGICLIVIGRFYQRILTRNRANNPPDRDNADTPQ